MEHIPKKAFTCIHVMYVIFKFKLLKFDLRKVKVDVISSVHEKTCL